MAAAWTVCTKDFAFSGTRFWRKNERPPASAGGLLIVPVFLDGRRTRDYAVANEQRPLQAVRRRASEMTVGALATGTGPMGRNHPAESQAAGIENSDQPQSRQI